MPLSMTDHIYYDVSLNDIFITLVHVSTLRCLDRGGIP